MYKRQLPDKERTSPLATGWLGIAKVGLGRSAEALVDLRAAANAAPDLPDAQFNLGLVLHRTGAHEEALIYLDHALALRPNLVAAWFARAEALEALGRNEEAIASAQRAVTIRPSHERANAALKRLSGD